MLNKIMFLLFFIISSLLATEDKYYSSEPISVVCKPCAVPSSSSVIWLPASRPPCLHPGQPIIHWPDSSSSSDIVSCPIPGLPDSIQSSQLSLLDDGLLLTKERVCFFDGPIDFHYNYICDGRVYQSKMRIGHSIASMKKLEIRRTKRWARRRNPDANAVHFQQEKYVKELPEDTPLETVIASVKASHASSQPLYYSMVAPQDSRSQNLFTLDTMSGEIRLAKSMDREVLDKHILKVTAYERVDPTISASTTVVVHVLDVQDNSPIFEKDSYFGEIREDAPIGTTVLSVFARDLDSGENGEVEYSLGEGNGKNLLAINSKSGVIQTAAPLDRETLSLIRLDVIASDKGIPKKESKALVEITVLDVNDNAPVFASDSYNITILENITLPTVIATVKATDEDFGTNGKVHYSMASSSGIGGLTIDYSSGEVTLRERIDAKNSPITAIIRAKDGAQPALSSTVPLTIHVVDINDHAPTLIAAQKMITLEENVAIGEEVGRVYAIDEDSGPNGIIRYSIEGPEDFIIDEDSGVIKTTKLLDRETTARYSLKVTARDMGTPPLNTSTTMTVVLKDINDNAPIFDKKEYNVTISEEMPRGSQIIKLKAVDNDEDQKITYRIEEADRDVFSILDIGDQGAILSVSGQLNKQDHKIRVEVSATDQGGLQGRCVVNVFIDDVNSAPYFNDHPFSAKIPEHSPIGYPVISMKAEDHDRGDNARLIYSIDSNQFFKIDPSSGDISVASDLDREDRATFSVIVTASDHATPPLNTSTQIEVILDDINDNAPQFTSSSYAATISEDIPVGTSFLQVSAIDADIGSNGIVDYFLNESSSSPAIQLFRLDRTSGTLRVSSKLDREQFAVIVLPIFARDRGTPSLSASSEITLTLSDVNDNAPSFEQLSYDLYIAENAPAGSTVGTIVARDADEGENSDISFRIFGGTDAKLFDIEEDAEQNGVVRILTRAEFDYEAKSNKFFFELQASSGQLSSTVPVRIHVSDVNDNKPVLKDFVILMNRFDNVQMARQIGFIPAFDPDQNATLEYFLEENDLIEAEKYTGKILVKQEWKRNMDVSFKTCVSDGANTECATCRFIHVLVEPDWLAESFTLSLARMTVDDFWDPLVFQRFRDAMSTLSNWKPSDIHVIGVKQHLDDVIYINLAITDHGRVVRGWRAIELVKESIKKLEKMTLLQVEVIRDESCANEPCSHMAKCRQTQKFVGEMKAHETDNFIARTLNTVNTFVCECPSGFTSSDGRGECDTRLDECYRGRCSNNSTCVAYENTYRCECKPGWIGRHCEISVHALTCVPGYCMSDSLCELEGNRMRCRHCKYQGEDTDERCRLRSVSFEGEGILNVNLDLPRTQWTMKFRISTIAHDGVLVFTGDKRSDFVEVSIVDRVLKVQFSLGGEKADAKMENDVENRVNDGEWHTVTVEFSNKQITMSLDDCETHPSLLLNSSPNCAVRAKLNLEKKCEDPTVPCYRYMDVSNGLFLGGRPGTSKQIEKAFSGCISDLSVDKEDVDFSTIKEMHKVGHVHEGCRQRRDFCSSSDGQCSATTKCSNRWGGRICSCPQAVHSLGECTVPVGNQDLRGHSLFEEESFVLYQPAQVSVPFEVSFEFRSSRADMQVFALEFTQRSVHYNLEIDDGTLKFNIGDSSVELPSPEITSKHWMNVVVKFEADSVATSINGIYSAEAKTSIADMNLESLYFGIAPGTGHPSRFEGCIRNVMVDGRPVSVKKKGKTRAGCVVPNRCSVDSICPSDSTCHRAWNKHKCKCQKSFVGDTCLPVCSVANVCSSGTCVASNTTTGYECICPLGRTGKNCQLEAPKQICPSGWWGTFPRCRRCACSQSKGYESQCDKKTGACLCKKSHFSTINGCVKCECGFGSESTECSSDGYCKCNGDAVGRRCDRCSRYDHQLDSKTLKCRPVAGKCPSEIEYSIQWPISQKGSIVRQSCPTGESGLATRKCLETGRWSDVNAWNCTRPEYSIMVNKFDILEPAKLLTMVSNATNTESSIRGRNQQIAAEALSRLVDHEQMIPLKGRAHIKDMKFTERLIEALGRVMSEQPADEYSTMIAKLWSYAETIAETHESVTFLSPFFIANDHIVFASDKLDFGNVLPKFNNFVDLRPTGFPRVRTIVTGTTQVVYSIVPYPRCNRCENPMIAVVANTTDPIIVEFEIDEDDGWKYPECVRFDDKSGVWTTRGASLIGLNLTHAACEYDRIGVFTMFVNDHSNSIVRVAQIDDMTSPAIAGVALFLCFLSILLTISRKSLKTHSVRIGFILFFAINVLNLFFVHKTAINQAFCPVRNAMLSFTSSSPFAWLFLYGLYIYRMLADGSSSPSVATSLLVGIVFPCIISFTTFFFTDTCSLSPNLWLFWFIVLPIGLFLLLSFYAAATSVLVSLHKKYDVFVAKYNVKKAVFQHFVLTLFTLVMTLSGLFANQLPLPVEIVEISQSVIYLIASIVIFLWCICDITSKSTDSNPNMWLDTQKSVMAESTMADPQCASPLLSPRNHHHDAAVDPDWMPDVIPNNHHLSSINEPDTPRRQLQPQNREVINILSSPDKILNEGIGHVYRNNMGSLPRLRSDQDEADDAYYTYTASRRYKNTTSTFNRE
ncbi:hypothetical protein B9Z55_019604 [Caenorhabditis nigoni]|uniref:Uncharacterized protein n=3 Tax=Caenorhabditis nigoni TaxID=1611254 RepID=A0A2G5TJP2_9PELO|nr:hypothetical protein B9Z55_019604 [Caenorhabditis nigoni]